MARSGRTVDLVGTSEAADVLECEKPRIGRYIKTGVMPEPVAKLNATPVWAKRDVEELKRVLGERESEHTRLRVRVVASPPMDLVGTREAAEILGVERTRIGRWIKTEQMPPMVAKLRATPVWWREDILELARRRQEVRQERDAERADVQRERDERDERAAA